MKQRYFSIIIGLALTMIAGSCTDFNEQFEGIDQMAKPTNLVNYEYTLTEDDYSTIASSALADATTSEDSAKIKSIKENKYFTDSVPASNYVPYLLEEMYKYNDAGSSAMVTYAFGKDKPPYISDLSTVSILNKDDYQLAWGSETDFVNAFTPAVSPADNLPEVLAVKDPNALDGQHKFVEYNYSSEDAVYDVTEVEYLAEDFESQTAYENINIEGWTNKDIDGELTWQAREYSSNLYAQVSSYNSETVNTAYLITSEIDLSSADAPEFTFDIKVGYWNETCLTVWISEDFDGTEGGITAATWVDLTSNFTLPEPASGYSDMESAGVADLTDYSGKQVYIAFRYEGDDSPGADPQKTTTYQVDNVKVSEVKVALSVDETEKQYVVYSYDGSAWEPAGDSFVAVQPADYDAMGLDDGYISPSDADLYIPNFLGSKFPYALEGSVKTVVYKSGSDQTKSDAVDYKLIAGEWVNDDFIEDKSEQFLYTIDGWLFDPTVNYTLVKDDYQIMVDYVKDNIDPNYIDSYGTAEYYYGFGSYHKNVNFRLSYRESYLEYDTEYAALETDEERIALLHNRLETEGMIKFAQLRFPDAVPAVSGVDVFYNITALLYYPTGTAYGEEFRTYSYQCTAAGTDDGTPPTFEFIPDS
ncbi:MAG: choice-of-anchor J domain-containing protein [Bacteroidales bacterium]|nr:choice-of-anchor J domain-containing protein [Bacteroidales bacterium]MDD4671678.1 choice-of-anchor J domain-containing protein [Bacteroidales bacterium]MDY0347807.1 choice-of-anchor J domain-containing protein [Tenuifilaceae bacterium]